MFLCAMKPKFSISECKGRIFYWFRNGMSVILTLFYIRIVESGGGRVEAGWMGGGGGVESGGENKSGGRTVSFVYTIVCYVYVYN